MPAAGRTSKGKIRKGYRLTKGGRVVKAKPKRKRKGSSSKRRRRRKR